VNTSYLRRIYLRLAGVVALVVMVALAVNGYLSQRAFEQALAPQLAAKVAGVGASIRSLVLRAVESGVDFGELYGVTERFTEMREEAPEVTYFALADTAGNVKHQKGIAPAGAEKHFRDPAVLALMSQTKVGSTFALVGGLYIVSIPIVEANKPLGMLHLGLDRSIFDALVLDMALDVVVVLVVSLFFTLELLHFMAGARLETSLRELGATFERGAKGDFTARRRIRGAQSFGSLLEQLDMHLTHVNRAFITVAREVESNRLGPAHERLSGLTRAQMGLRALAEKCRFGIEKNPPPDREALMAKVRAPLFMFILAEELTRSFLPGYVKELLIPIPGLSADIVVGLPIALFMLIVAIGQPFLGVFTERVGHRRAMLTGAAIAATGFVATAFAHSVLDLLLWRSLCAVGYAMVFVAGQGYVLEHATTATRARSFALFVGAIMAATVCGPSIGGILADNIGARYTFGIAAVLAAASMAVIAGLPRGRGAAQGKAPARLPTWGEIGALVTNRRFMTVTALAAVPAKVLLTGVCFYLIPLYVVELGSTQAMAGRILMTYAILMVVLGPLMAGVAVDRKRMHALVAGGLVVSGLGGMAMLGGHGVGWVFLAVALVGVGQSMSIAAQSALLSEHCAPEIAKLGEGVVYGVYRLLERLGNAAGPLLAAALAMQFDYRAGFVVIGAAVCLCGAAFFLSSRQPMTRKARAPLFSPQEGIS
jgi:MFS family permease